MYVCMYVHMCVHTVCVHAYRCVYIVTAVSAAVGVCTCACTQKNDYCK